MLHGGGLTFPTSKKFKRAVKTTKKHSVDGTRWIVGWCFEC